MKIVIHIGMHKTGSSSIQQTFARFQHPGLEYINWNRGGNHSALYVLLFEDIEKLRDYHIFKARGPAFVRTLPEMREKWRAQVSEQLAQAGDRTIIFSAEAISLAQFANAGQRLHDFCAVYSNDISVLGYVRPPGGFIARGFQQYLKGGTIARVFDGGASPHYRERFEWIDQVFGRSTVTLKEFAPRRLQGGDVVKDFSEEVGVAPLSEDQIIRTNESLSLEAVAVLYVQRRLGQGFVLGFNRANAANKAFTSSLAKIGSGKFSLSSKMLAPILEKERDDIAWMEARLGHPFSDSGKDNKDAIDSLDDLVDIALGQFDAVQDLLGDNAVDGPATTETLVKALERLREQCYAAALATDIDTVKTMTKTGDFTMATKTERPKPTEEELRVRAGVARSLWRADNKGNLPSDLAERKAAFDLVKRDYNKKAAILVQQLEKTNLKLVEIDPKS